MLALLPLALLAGGCRAGTTAADAGQEGDARIDCSGDAVCDGTVVRACRMGKAAEVIDDCAPGLACSLGRCTSSACAEAEADRTTIVGCTFYTFDLDNVTSDDPLPSSVLVTNPGQVAATATLERRNGAGAAWSSATNVIVPPMRSARLVLPDNHLEGGGLARRGAFRVTSDLPLTAAHIQSDDSTPGGSSSSGGTMLLPAQVLGLRYRALTYGQVATPALQDTPGARGGAGEIMIVGTAGGTNVTIVPSATAILGAGGGTAAPGPDGKVHATLDDGDVFTLFSNRDGADLSGTLVTGDQPIAVFSGNISTTYGITATGINSPDLADEQLMPVAAWSTSYVAARLPPQTGVCDPVLSPPGSSIWTIVADRDGTSVHFSDASGGEPAPHRDINAGETFHVTLPSDFVVTSAGGPIEIMQGMDCEPSLSSAVPTSTWLEDYWFAVLPNFDTLIGIVRAAGQPVYLDGVQIEEGAFTRAGGGFDVARLPLEACPTAEAVCTHHLEGKFGFTMRGMDVLTSYALTAPTWPCTVEMPTCIQ